VTAPVTAVAPPDQGKSGCPVCRRPAREGDDDSPLKHDPAECLSQEMARQERLNADEVKAPAGEALAPTVLQGPCTFATNA
jgi:hypothetical protein